MEVFFNLIVSGVMVGSIYALVALGWVLIYKCSGVLNLAMGELTLIGAYVSLTLYTAFVQDIGQSTIAFILALLGTLTVGAIVGLLTERLFLRRMIGEQVLSVIMITVGLSFFFKGIVEFIWMTDTRVFTPPVFSKRPLSLWGDIYVDSVYLWSFIAAMILLLILVLFFKYSRWGLAMQATADDEMAALSLGVSAKRVYALAWAVAFMSAGVGGALLGNVNGVNISVGYLGLLVLPAVVLGGLNSIPGAIFGGIIIGVLQNLADGYLSQYTPGGVKEVAPLAFMVIVLLFRPHGLWGWERIERV